MLNYATVHASNPAAIVRAMGLGRICGNGQLSYALPTKDDRVAMCGGGSSHGVLLYKVCSNNRLSWRKHLRFIDI